MWNFHWKHRLPRPCWPSWTLWGVNMNYWRHIQIWTANERAGTLGFLGLCTAFRCLVTNFSCLASLMNNKLRNSQLQTSHRLIDDKTTTLEMLIAKLVEGVCCIFHVCNAPSQSTLTHVTARLDAGFRRNNITLPTDQLYTGLISLTTPSGIWHQESRVFGSDILHGPSLALPPCSEGCCFTV